MACTFSGTAAAGGGLAPEVSLPEGQAGTPRSGHGGEPLVVVGLCGRLGTGKDTVADVLQRDHGFQRASFAGVLKDVVAAAFTWNRDLLEGRTQESRTWREQVDPQWAAALQMPELTPRLALQLWGTDVVRENFHPNFWLKALERGVLQGRYGRRVVITDCRFANECDMVRALRGSVVCVERGPHPEWERALRAHGTRPSGIHESEWAWMGQEDDVVENDGTLEELAETVADLAAGLLQAPPPF